MKDQADTLTPELPLARRRGRPSTGEAMTPAQRKRAQRARDRAASMTDDYISCTNERLLRELGFAVTHGLCYLSQAIARELQARAESVYDLKAEKARQHREAVTVTQNSVVHWPMPEPVTVTEKPGDDLDDMEQPAPVPAKRSKPAPKLFQLTIPATYWDDYSERCPVDVRDQLAIEVRRAANRVTIQANDVQLKCLKSDAAFYAEGNTDNTPHSVIRGAKRVVFLCDAALID